MKIISSFSDYYDGAARLGQDFSILYLRKTETTEYTNIDLMNYYNSIKLKRGKAVVGFCGQLIPLFSLDSAERIQMHHELTPKSYTVDYKTAIAELEKRNTDIYNVTQDARHLTNLKKLKEVPEIKKHVVSFQELETPVFVYTPEITIINFSLKNIEFFRLKNSYEAYQEINMFMSGILTKQKKEVYNEKNDIILRNMHGFDKYSFKSSPKKKK
jgi:hypothetical protein